MNVVTWLGVGVLVGIGTRAGDFIYSFLKAFIRRIWLANRG